VKLLDFEDSAPNAAAQFGFRQILQNEFGLEDAAELAIGAVKPILGTEGGSVATIESKAAGCDNRMN
jgi:hypothetical protein